MRRTAPAIAAATGRHGREPRAHRRLRSSRTRWYAAGDVVANRAAFAFPRADLFRYSAKWWSYLVPPVAHPAARRHGASRLDCGRRPRGAARTAGQPRLGNRRARAHRRRGGWSRPRERHAGVAARACPVLVIVAVAALLCSLSPERTIGAFTFVRPSALLYDVVPMFRSYARFGVVVQLMAALLAGIGVDYLRRGRHQARAGCVRRARGARRRRIRGLAAALWRDVLPTTAHRWVTQQPADVRVLDCTPLTQESAIGSVADRRSRDAAGRRRSSDCTEPNLSRKLAASGYTHLLVRRDTADGRWFADRPSPDGLRVAARFDDGQVFAVTATTPPIYTADDDGVLSARARCGLVVAMDGERTRPGRS